MVLLAVIAHISPNASQREQLSLETSEKQLLRLLLHYVNLPSFAIVALQAQPLVIPSCVIRANDRFSSGE